jgi:transglutaminase-like putative cysteine protease
MKYQILHRTEYRYSQPVSRSMHLTHFRPRPLARQEVLEFNLKVHPSPVERVERRDYFGNPIEAFTIEGMHEKLKIEARSVVKIQPLKQAPVPQVAWEEVSQHVFADRSRSGLRVREFLGETYQTPRLPELDEYVRSRFTPGRSFVEAVLDLNQQIHRDYEFDAKATTVSTPLEQVVRQRRGVCQDFAHLMIACLRSVRLPACYVSGYLRTLPPPGQPRLVGADASHAWVAVYSAETGWLGVDPTNNRVVDQDYVTLSWGREYSDVSLIRGTLDGGGAHKLRFSVDVVPDPSSEV